MNYEFEGKYILEFENGDSVEFDKIEFDSIYGVGIEFNVWGDDLDTNPTLNKILKKMDDIIEGRGYFKKQDICFDAKLFEIVDDEKQPSMELKCIVPITFGEYFAFAADYFIANRDNEMAMTIVMANRQALNDMFRKMAIPITDVNNTYHILQEDFHYNEDWDDDFDEFEVKRPSFKQRLHNFFKAFIDLW